MRYAPVSKCCVQFTAANPDKSLERRQAGMIALGGNLYVHGGIHTLPDGEDEVLLDILVARASGSGGINQPWKRLSICEASPQACSPMIHFH